MTAAPGETFAGRGWSAAGWDAARQRLTERPPADEDGLATDAVGELHEPLGPLWVSVLGSGMLPSVTTLGIGKV